MNWSIVVLGLAMDCGGFAMQPPPDVVFSVTPRRGGMAGSITTVDDYKNARKAVASRSRILPIGPVLRPACAR